MKRRTSTDRASFAMQFKCVECNWSGMREPTTMYKEGGSKWTCPACGYAYTVWNPRWVNDRKNRAEWGALTTTVKEIRAAQKRVTKLFNEWEAMVTEQAERPVVSASNEGGEAQSTTRPDATAKPVSRHEAPYDEGAPAPSTDDAPKEREQRLHRALEGLLNVVMEPVTGSRLHEAAIVAAADEARAALAADKRSTVHCGRLTDHDPHDYRDTIVVDRHCPGAP